MTQTRNTVPDTLITLTLLEIISWNTSGTSVHLIKSASYTVCYVICALEAVIWRNYKSFWAGWTSFCQIASKIGDALAGCGIKGSSWVASYTPIRIWIITSCTRVTTFHLALWPTCRCNVSNCTFRAFCQTCTFITKIKTSWTSGLIIRNWWIITSVTTHTLWNVCRFTTFTASSTWKTSLSFWNINVTIKTWVNVASVKRCCAAFAVLYLAFSAFVLFQGVTSQASFACSVEIALKTALYDAVDAYTGFRSFIEYLRWETRGAFIWHQRTAGKATITRYTSFCGFFKCISNFACYTLPTKIADRTKRIAFGLISCRICKRRNNDILFNNKNAIPISIVLEICSTRGTWIHTRSITIVLKTYRAVKKHINTLSVSIVLISKSAGIRLWSTKSFTIISVPSNTWKAIALISITCVSLSTRVA